MPSDSRVTFYSRNLPHWRLDGAYYFVTFRTYKTELTPEEISIVLEHIKHGDKKYYSLIAVVVLPDHVHVIIKPSKHYTLSRILKGIKGVSSRLVNVGRGISDTVWQRESYDRIIRDEDELSEKITYMYNNSVNKGLVTNPEDYSGWYYYTEYELL